MKFNLPLHAIKLIMKLRAMINIRILGAIIISAVNFNSAGAWDFDHSYDPIERTTPVKLLHISGQLSPQLSIKMRLTYLTTNNSCRITTSWIEGASAARTKRITVPVRETSDGYDAIVPLDKFEEGYCKWLPFSIDLLVNGIDVPNSIWIQTPGYKDPWFAQDGINNPKKFNFICRGKTICEPSPPTSHDITTETREIKVDFITGAQQ